MCRLFGFRSVILSQVHQSLVQADNALEVQSREHPHGWGVAYYVRNSPHIIKSTSAALEDKIFKKVSGVVSSQTVLGHIRKATIGETNILNTHPFQYGHWTFAHNGNIKNFDKHREKIIEHIPEYFQKFILGTTDSETLFYFLLSKVSKDINLSAEEINIEEFTNIINEAINELIEIVGDLNFDEDAPPTENFVSFIITNGNLMLAFNGGKKLYYSTYKNKCLDRDTCSSYSPECEAPTKTGFVNHLIFSSEPLSGDNIWIDLGPKEILGIDYKMKIFKKTLD
ncbi:glutamine amidotransferase domain protein [Halobacteriovorax sp. BALOs_7]|uniref:class II glutamine amidotransferase n=1 Tax=Halobacteriovorax sp. BALOs_7 TaxID=2109558 RepID=UPI000EA1EE26|nr:class II glutamine amidotransferase [Halobacteriovorax sp. BALOs_7]AYF45546.1 glutamine amidotransferase domain protein [Halobacteriovorax sp. BALOs_7]